MNAMTPLGVLPSTLLALREAARVALTSLSLLANQREEAEQGKLWRGLVDAVRLSLGEELVAFVDWKQFDQARLIEKQRLFVQVDLPGCWPILASFCRYPGANAWRRAEFIGFSSVDGHPGQGSLWRVVIWHQGEQHPEYIHAVTLGAALVMAEKKEVEAENGSKNDTRSGTDSS